MNDPLADLLTSMGDEIGQCTCDGCNAEHAEWLRANRDRVLDALGGEQDVYDLEVLGPTILWLFPLGEDQ